MRGTPTPDDAPIGDVRAFFEGNGAYLVGDYVAGLAFMLCFLPYLAGLRSILGRAEGGAEFAARLVLVGGLATVLVGDASTVFLDTVAVGDAQLADSTIRALLYANTMAIAAIGLPMALFAFAAAAVAWRTGALGRPLAVLAAAAGVLHTAGAAFPIEGAGGVLFTLRFAGLITFMLFILASSVTLVAGKAIRLGDATPSGSRRP